MKIAVVGAGYVGLVAGTCLAETGHNVRMIEIDERKLERLRSGQVPFYEPGLTDLLNRNFKRGRLQFTSDYRQALDGAACCFIAVGTPQDSSGKADLSQVLAAAEKIGRSMTGKLIVIIKSTVPVGTHKLVAERLSSTTKHPFTVVSNPEFLKEGAAVDDFMKPDRVVIGTEDEEARRTMADLYKPFVRTGNPIMFMDNTSAEMAKYASNVLLATRISFMNELALVCDRVGADIEKVRLVVGSDRRIGPAFLFAGAGFGGSCFPKDVSALKATGGELGIDLHIPAAVEKINARQKELIPRRVLERFGDDLGGKTFAIWGLSFKPRTDDVRDAPALTVARILLEHGATLSAYDPEAMENARRELGDSVRYFDDAYEALRGADALLVMTEWNEFRYPDFDLMLELMRRPIVYDGRNIYDPERMEQLGFEYHCIGRGRA